MLVVYFEPHSGHIETFGHALAKTKRSCDSCQLDTLYLLVTVYAVNIIESLLTSLLRRQLFGNGKVLVEYSKIVFSFRKGYFIMKIYARA